MREEKSVTYKNLKVGQEIQGTQDGNSHSSFSAIVKDVNSAFVTIWMWGKKDREEKINSDVMFYVKMTEDEFKEKYSEKAKEVMKNIQNKLIHDEIGYHEMWNSWLYGTPYEIAQECASHNLKVIGHCTDIAPKQSLITDDTYDIGVCAEYDDGERIWCHFSTQCLNDLLEDNPELLN